MTLEGIIKTLILIHAGFGGIALIAGFVPLFTKKGGKLHKKIGKLFVIALQISASISVIIACLPNHHNVFLFVLGILTIYLTIMGIRVLQITSESNLKVEKTINYILGACGLALLFFTFKDIFIKSSFNLIYAIYSIGILALFLIDFFKLKNKEAIIQKRIQKHLSYLCIALIASITAFIVVNDMLPNTILNWLLPGIIGTPYITYWNNKLAKKNKKL